MAFAALMIPALGAGCVGHISGPGGQASGVGARSGSATTGGSGAGASGAASGTGGAPTLSDRARYFPGQAAQNAPARVVRLTRTQLDLTTRTLLPKVAIDSASTALPNDPLQTNYEYADNLSFNPANFTPFRTGSPRSRPA